MHDLINDQGAEVISIPLKQKGLMHASKNLSLKQI